MAGEHADGHADIDAIHDFWFGELDDTGLSATGTARLWFSASDATDVPAPSALGTLAQALAGSLTDWAEQRPRAGRPGGAAGPVHPQYLPRHAAAFAGDAARAGAGPAVHRQRPLPAPAGHSPGVPVPAPGALRGPGRCRKSASRCSRSWPTRHRQQQIADFTRYAMAHRDVIAQFGRFPHRNAILGRDIQLPRSWPTWRHTADSSAAQPRATGQEMVAALGHLRLPDVEIARCPGHRRPARSESLTSG